MIFAAHKQPDAQFASAEFASIYYWMGGARLIGAPIIGGSIFAAVRTITDVFSLSKLT